MPESPTFYHLVATVGSSPAVVTEIVWYYATDHMAPRFPAAVTILTTNHGWRQWTTRVQYPGGTSPWDQLRARVLDGLEVPVEVLRPRRDGGLAGGSGAERDFLNDITDELEDERAANLCYEVVYRLTQSGQLPLVGSMAGGRKTMSAHLMAAFAAYARRNDELVHVLVRQEDEHNPDYFFPAPGVDHYTSGIRCIQIPFPQLRTYLERDLFRQIPGDRRDLRALMGALKRYDFADPTVEPPAPILYIGRGPAGSNLVEFPDARGDDQGSCQLSTQSLATLLTLAEAFARHGKPVSATELVDQDARRRYLFCTSLNPTKDTYQSWRDGTALSQAVSRLNDQLKWVPVAQAYLSITGHKKSGQYWYYWTHKQPVALRVQADPSFYRKARAWPAHFERLRIEQVG